MSQDDEAFNPRELFRTLFRGRWVILAITLLIAGMAVVVTLSLPNQYKATAILMPATDPNNSSLSRMAGQLGGLASLAGVNLGGQEERKTVAAMQLINAWGFQEDFVREHNLEVAVFASKGWDRRTNQLIIDPDLYDTQQHKWVRKFDPDRGETAEPNGWELYKKLSKRVSVTEDTKTSVITLSVEFYSPQMAKEWVDGLVSAVNKHLQERDRVEAEKSIRYLEEKLAQTNLVEIRSALSRLVEEQTKTLMLARVNDEYVLKTLSPAKVPQEKSTPQRALICVGAAIGGFFFGTLCWLMWSASRRWFA